MKPSSSPPPILVDEEAGWDAVFETAHNPQVSEPETNVDVPGDVLAATTSSDTSSSSTLSGAPSEAPTANSLSAHAVPKRTVTKTEAERVPNSLGGSRVALFIAAAAAILGGAWFFFQAKPGPKPASSVPVATAAPIEAAVPTTSASAVALEAPVVPAGAPNAALPVPTTDELIVVTVTAIPPEARFYYKGKPIGRSPLRVELKPGQRRSFELGQTGFHTRKVVVDGTKKEVTVALRPNG